ARSISAPAIDRAIPGSSAAAAPGARPDFMMSKSAAPTEPPRKCKPPAVTSSTAAALSSGERGTWPSTRAFCRRLAVGFSFRSWSFSATASGSAQVTQEGQRDRQQTDEARFERRQPHDDDDETEDKRDGQSDGKDVQCRGGTTDDAEGEVGDEQRGHGGQRYGERTREELRAPRHHRPEACGPEPSGADRQSVEPIDQRLDEREVPVEDEEDQ